MTRRSDFCVLCQLGRDRCQCAPIDRTLAEDVANRLPGLRVGRTLLTNALRSWAWVLLQGHEPLEQRKARSYPFYAAADELDGRPLSGWCAAYLETVVAVLERELHTRPRYWAASFTRVPASELERAIDELRERARPLYQSRAEAAE